MKENALLENAKQMQDTLLQMRRTLHQTAEIGFALPKTLAYIQEQLLQMGYTPKKCGKSGWVVDVGDESKGKTILLRADIDGLPIRERTGLKFACKTGNMHACGHDLHATMLLGAAKLLKAQEARLKGRVRLLFQPAEELLEGAKDVIKHGALQGVDTAVMLHVLTNVALPTGSVVVACGVSAPAADFFTIKVQGKGCHGSAPWNGIDALSVAAHILLALQGISAREISIAQPAVLTIGGLQTQDAGNVISDTAILKGSLRAFDEKVRLRVKTRMEEIAKNVAKAFRAKVKIEYGGGCPTLVNDSALSAFACDSVKRLLGNERAHLASDLGGGDKENSGGSEDFAYISHQIPSVMLALSAGESKDGYTYPLHHPKTAFDETALHVGAAVYAHIAIRWLEDN